MKNLLQKTCFMFIALAMNFASCTNENVPELNQSELIETSNSVRFKYLGIEYLAEYEIQNSQRIFKDKTLGEMLQTLENDSLCSSITYPNGMIEYFDSIEDFEKRANTLKEGNISSKSIPYKVLIEITLKIYEHENYQGENFTYRGETFVHNLRNATNKPENGVTNPDSYDDFNDKMTSFQFIGSLRTYDLTIAPPPTHNVRAMVTFYEDAEYKSKAMAYIIDTQNPQVLISNIGKGFNDKASSIKMTYL